VTNYVISYVTRFGLLFTRASELAKFVRLTTGALIDAWVRRAVSLCTVTNTQIHLHCVFLPYRNSDSSAQKFSKNCSRYHSRPTADKCRAKCRLCSYNPPCCNI